MDRLEAALVPMTLQTRYGEFTFHPMRTIDGFRHSATLRKYLADAGLCSVGAPSQDIDAIVKGDGSIALLSAALELDFMTESKPEGFKSWTEAAQDEVLDVWAKVGEWIASFRQPVQSPKA